MPQYQVLHMKKLHQGDLGGIANHMTKREKVKTNKTIDLDRTHLNYSIDGLTAEHLVRRVNERIQAAVNRKVRADAVRLVDVIIGASHDWMMLADRATRDAYFKDAVKYLAEKFGRENIMYANVHMDEDAIQMHVGLVPITPDGRLSAKILFGKQQLRDWHTEFNNLIGKKYGLARGEDSANKGYVDIWALKAKVENEIKAADLAQGDFAKIAKKREYGRKWFGLAEDKSVMQLPSKDMATLLKIGKVGVKAIGVHGAEIDEKRRLETVNKVQKEAAQQKIATLTQKLEQAKIYTSAPEWAKENFGKMQVGAARYQHTLHRDCVRAYLTAGRDFDKAVKIMQPALSEIGITEQYDQRAYVKACLSAARKQAGKALILDKQGGARVRQDYHRTPDNLQTWHPSAEDTDYMQDDDKPVAALPASVRLDAGDPIGLDNWALLTDAAKDEILAKRSMRNM